MKNPSLLIAIALISLMACTKNADTGSLPGKWQLKSQYDSVFAGGQTGRIQFSSLQYLEFSTDGRVYSNGVVTPTWALQPHMGSSPYKLKALTIIVGDSVNLSGQVLYLTYPKKFKIISVSRSLLVLQHLNPNIYTIDSLIR